MSTARYWRGSRLLLTWLALAAAFAAFRWSMVAGTYRAWIENQEVTTAGGVWSPAFASTMTLIGAGVLALALLGMTASWIAGKRDRQARKAAAKAGHRKVLM